LQNLDYIQSDSEAQSAANALLVPNPKSGGSITVAWDETIMVNETVALVDAVRNINGNYVVLEQRIGNGMTTLQLGWTKTQGYLDAKREEIELRKARARTLGTSLDSDVIEINGISEYGNANNVKSGGVDEHPDDETKSGGVDEHPDDETKSGVDEHPDDETKSGGVDEHPDDETKSGGVDEHPDDETKSGEISTAVPGVAPSNSVQKSVSGGVTSGNMYRSSYVNLSPVCHTTGTDVDEGILFDIYYNDRNSWGTRPTQVYLEITLNNDVDGNGNDMFIYRDIIPYPSEQEYWLRKWMFIPANAIYQLDSNIDVVKSIQVAFKVLDGENSAGTYSTTFSVDVHVIERHTHSDTIDFSGVDTHGHTDTIDFSGVDTHGQHMDILIP